MYQIIRPIISKQTLKPAMWQITIGLAERDPVAHVEPGQFFLAQCAVPFSTYLRRPIFPANVATITAENRPDYPLGLQFLFTAADLADPGLAWLSSRQVGETIDLLGPCGHGFSLSARTESLLLIGSGPMIGPLLFLLHRAIQDGVNVVLALEAPRITELYPTQTLPPAAELRIATLDGSAGYRGRILDHLGDLTQWADTLCAIGPLSFYYDLRERLNQTRLHLIENFARVLVTHPPIHVCGTGICTLCTLRTTKGLRLACQDGPVFDLATLSLEMPI